MSARRFQVGDRVRIVRSPYAHMIGREGTVVAHSEVTPWDFDYSLPAGTSLCVLGIPSECPDAVVGYPHGYLAPIHDGDEKLSWSDERVVWKPRAIA